MSRRGIRILSILDSSLHLLFSSPRKENINSCLLMWLYYVLVLCTRSSSKDILFQKMSAGQSSYSFPSMSVGLEDIPDDVIELLSQSQSEGSDQDPDFVPYSSSPEDISSSCKSVYSQVNKHSVCWSALATAPIPALDGATEFCFVLFFLGSRNPTRRTIV